VFALAGELRYSAICSALVAIEVLVLVFNSWQCPLTAVASRYTTDRRDNFDIYLPEWLARHNKLIFGAMYVAGLLFLLYSWSSAVAMEAPH
jgi:polyferredoxin